MGWSGGVGSIGAYLNPTFISGVEMTVGVERDGEFEGDAVNIDAMFARTELVETFEDAVFGLIVDGDSSPQAADVYGVLAGAELVELGTDDVGGRLYWVGQIGKGVGDVEAERAMGIDIAMRMTHGGLLSKSLALPERQGLVGIVYIVTPYRLYVNVSGARGSVSAGGKAYS